MALTLLRVKHVIHFNSHILWGKLSLALPRETKEHPTVTQLVSGRWPGRHSLFYFVRRPQIRWGLSQGTNDSYDYWMANPSRTWMPHWFKNHQRGTILGRGGRGGLLKQRTSSYTVWRTDDLVQATMLGLLSISLISPPVFIISLFFGFTQLYSCQHLNLDLGSLIFNLSVFWHKPSRLWIFLKIPRWLHSTIFNSIFLIIQF